MYQILTSKQNEISKVGSMDLSGTSVTEAGKVAERLLNFYYIARGN